MYFARDFQNDLVNMYKVSESGVFSGPYFPALELNTEMYKTNLRIQFECGKMQTKKSSGFGHYSSSVQEHSGVYSGNQNPLFKLKQLKAFFLLNLFPSKNMVAVMTNVIVF